MFPDLRFLTPYVSSVVRGLLWIILKVETFYLPRNGWLSLFPIAKEREFVLFDTIFQITDLGERLMKGSVSVTMKKKEVGNE